MYDTATNSEYQCVYSKYQCVYDTAAVTQQQQKQKQMQMQQALQYLEHKLTKIFNRELSTSHVHSIQH